LYSLSRLLPIGFRRKKAAYHALANAYRAVFSGGEATRVQRDLVITDLATFSRAYVDISPTATDAELRFTEGKRAVFRRIFSFLNLSDDGLRELERVAQQELATTYHEGDI
jgi:hypothetical protein